jgi:hypothetical protein
VVADAHDVFFGSLRAAVRLGDRESLGRLKQAASSWRAQGKHFSAGYAMEWAINSAWGNLDEMKVCWNAAIEEYKRSTETHHACAYETLLSLNQMARLFWREYLMPSRAEEFRQESRQLLQELAERLVACFANSDWSENYLVRGVILEGDLVGGFTPSYPDYEVDWTTETWDRAHVSIRLPSAFQLLVYLGDYRGAQVVVDKCPEAFTTAGLRGWKAAIRGFIEPEVAVENFEEAAQAFAEDRCPDNLGVGRSWSSINVDLWSPYFRARSLVANTIRAPLNTKELVAKAAESFAVDRVRWAHPEAMRFAVLVRSLAQLVGGTQEVDWRPVREEFLRTVRMTGKRPEDPLVNCFLTLAADAFEGFVADPARELTQGRLRQALNVLNRIPLLQEGIAEAIAPAVGEQALDLVYDQFALACIGPWKVFETRASCRRLSYDSSRLRSPHMLRSCTDHWNMGRMLSSCLRRENARY